MFQETGGQISGNQIAGSLIKGPKESRSHAGKIRGTRTYVRGNKRFKENGRSWDRGGTDFRNQKA
jgi:hypothetical protein